MRWCIPHDAQGAGIEPETECWRRRYIPVEWTEDCRFEDVEDEPIMEMERTVGEVGMPAPWYVILDNGEGEDRIRMWGCHVTDRRVLPFTPEQQAAIDEFRADLGGGPRDSPSG
jgi:hypothetical protein